MYAETLCNYIKSKIYIQKNLRNDEFSKSQSTFLLKLSSFLKNIFSLKKIVVTIMLKNFS